MIAHDSMLSGMRIVEVSAFVAAPLGGMTLAQLGADVIRVDAIGGGLDHHRWPVTDDNVSLFWCGLNKCKRSVAIDIGSDEGREIAMALIAAPGDGGGMLLTNFPARGWLGYDKLRASRDDLIQLTIQGDRHGASAVDYTVNPKVGLPYLTGPIGEDEVVNHVLPSWDLITGHMAAIGLLAAERHRRLRGEGQHIQLALEDMALAVMGHLGFIAEAQLGHKRARIGNYLYGAFGRDFVTADKMRIMVVGLTPKQWRALCEATALSDRMTRLAQQLQLDFDAEGDRYVARVRIAALIETWIAARTLDQIATVFDAHAVCWERYQTVVQMVGSDPACSELNPMFRTVDQPGVGSYLMPGAPLTSSVVNRIEPRAAPALGQHTAEVLTGVLGLSDAAVGRLLERQLIDCGPTA